ncbi:uncharacterized protein LOC109541917 isoform X2 [Dendroctonus ponderosae]|uniref:uncharacterized protein LOC109541917 isoform X2 n=1 Tax=Dendroctonus ponderosae TaxID=77166 RepID=UPI002035582F|nr:uncharacterized protein LOC109541917 isoform X2 [Dendroctonus ponderosae]
MQKILRRIGKTSELAQKTASGEAGKKGYYGQHSSEKGELGHHDKENHKNIYAEAGGNKKSHHHDDGYYADGHKATHDENGYHFVDKGSYAKGHDTKGHHIVQRLNEFEKKKEFFDEDHDEAHKERHGSFDVGEAFKKGEVQHGGHTNKASTAEKYGSSAKSEKGAFNAEESGHDKSAGIDQNFKSAEEQAKKGIAVVFKEVGLSDKKVL